MAGRVGEEASWKCAIARRREDHSAWGVAGNDVVDTRKGEDRAKREEEERRRGGVGGKADNRVALMNEIIAREPRVFCTCNLFV